MSITNAGEARAKEIAILARQHEERGRRIVRKYYAAQQTGYYDLTARYQHMLELIVGTIRSFETEAVLVGLDQPWYDPPKTA